MSIKAHHVIVSLFIGAIGLASLAWLGTQAPAALAQCGTGASIGVAVPASGQSLSGVVSLTAYTPNSGPMPSGVTFEFSTTQQPIGSVSTPNTGGPSPSGVAWVFNWDSHSVADGSYSFMAIAHYGASITQDCPSTPVTANVYNSSANSGSQPTLSINISPASWEGAPGQNQQFSVTGVFTDQLGVQHPVTPANGATYQWGTNAGLLSPNGTPTITLIDGSVPGTFNIGVAVQMNGLTATKGVTVKIVLPGSNTATQPSPTATPPPGSGTGDGSNAPLTPAQIQALSTIPTIFRPTNATNSNPVVPIQTLGCLEEKLGAAFNPISSGQSQATIDQRVLGSSCFSGANKIPATLAPVDPANITDIPTTNNLVTLSDVKNEIISGKSKVTAILLSGNGTPNSSVYLYIFSDPMVLRARTDSQGKWSYVLENPLKPGHHEFYAVSQQDSSSFVRTPAIPVSIAAAAPGSSDGSLIIEHTLTPTQIGYIAGSAVMVLAGLILLWRLLRRRRPQALSGAAPVVVTPNTNPPAPAPTAPENHDLQT